MPNPHNGNTTITNEEINLLPLGAFDGKVVVISDPEELANAFREINRHSTIGFDTETKPVFVRGQYNKVAILQIALPETVYIIRLMATGLTPEIIQFLQNESIEKAGVAIRDDLKALQHLKKFKPAGFVELALLSKDKGLEVESVKKLTALLLGFRISKSAQTSNWEAPQLNEKQVSYAATDAWVCLNIYETLKKMPAVPKPKPSLPEEEQNSEG
ncbi:MAG: 3'-5' exonuclease domain-containing protein 2 [Cyclobacteriaceae bacterium]|nr:3'-5' exonuclease domain-containing protein 2 [Cyclobacteriaceae bacterium]